MSSTPRRPAPEPRKPPEPGPRRYSRPRLDRLGDVRGLTLGTSVGIPDSGIGVTQQQQP